MSTITHIKSHITSLISALYAGITLNSAKNGAGIFRAPAHSGDGRSVFVAHDLAGLTHLDMALRSFAENNACFYAKGQPLQISNKPMALPDYTVELSDDETTIAVYMTDYPMFKCHMRVEPVE